jgi:hypothetical protein
MTQDTTPPKINKKSKQQPASLLTESYNLPNNHIDTGEQDGMDAQRLCVAARHYTGLLMNTHRHEKLCKVKAVQGPLDKEEVFTKFYLHGTVEKDMENICKILKTFHRKLRTLLLVLSRNFCIDGKNFARHNNSSLLLT